MGLASPARSQGVRPPLSRTVVLDTVIIQGEHKTVSSYLVREMNIQKGDEIPYADLDRVLTRNQQLIYNTGLFTKVVLTHTLVRNRLTIIITLEERWYLIPSFNYTIADVTLTDWLKHPDFSRITYGLGLAWSNISGRNDRLNLSYTQGFAQSYIVSYSRPFIAKHSLTGGGFNFSYIANDDVIYGFTHSPEVVPKDPRDITTTDTAKTISYSGNHNQRVKVFGKPVLKIVQFNVNITHRFTQNNGLNFAAGYKDINIYDTLQKKNPYFTSNTNHHDLYSVVSANYWWDSRDVRAFPLRGINATAGVTVNGMDWFSTTQFVKVMGSISRYKPIGRGFYIANGLQSYFLIGKRIPYPDKVLLANAPIRGFNSFVLDGSFVVTSRNEFKYELLKRKILHVNTRLLPRQFRDFPFGIYPFSFFDVGMIRDNTAHLEGGDYFKNKALMGYGLGLDIPYIYDFLFRLTIARNNFGQTSWLIDFSASL